MSGVRTVVVSLLLLGTLPAGAAELTLGWDGRGVWTSNIFRTETDEEDAYSVYTGPDIGLVQRQGDLRYDLRYRPRYEAFFDLSDANALEHYASVTGSWDVDRLTQVSIDNRFSRSHGLRDVFEQAGVDPEEGEIFIDRQVVVRNAGVGSVSRWLSERNQLVLNFSQQYTNYDEENRADAVGYRGAASLRRLLTRRQTAGIGFGVTRQDNLQTDFQEGRGTTYVETFALYDLVVSRSLRFSISGGPTWVLPDEFSDERSALQYSTIASRTQTGQRFTFLADRASCAASLLASSCSLPAGAFRLDNGNPAFAPLTSIPVVAVPFEDAPSAETDITFFGSAGLSYARRPYTWDLRYTRRASSTSGTGVSTTLDIASATATWEPARRWRLSARASWQRQLSSSELPIVAGVVGQDGVTVYLNQFGIPVSDPADATFEVRNVAEVGSVRTVDLDDDAIDFTTYTVNLRASHSLTRRLQLRAEAAYWYQITGGDESDDDGHANSLRFELGFTWSYDPISL